MNLTHWFLLSLIDSSLKYRRIASHMERLWVLIISLKFSINTQAIGQFHVSFVQTNVFFFQNVWLFIIFVKRYKLFLSRAPNITGTMASVRMECLLDQLSSIFIGFFFRRKQLSQQDSFSSIAYFICPKCIGKDWIQVEQMLQDCWPCSYKYKVMLMHQS